MHFRIKETTMDKNILVMFGMDTLEAMVNDLKNFKVEVEGEPFEETVKKALADCESVLKDKQS
jgi:hypothetical protein